MTPKYKKVYVIAPQNNVTGGVELAHQFVDYINNNGGDAFIVYENNGKIVNETKVTSAYEGYNIKIATEIEDSHDNILVLPEVYCDWMYQYKYIMLGFWWMSVDNRYKTCKWTEIINFKWPFRFKLSLIKGNLIRGTKNTLSDIRSLKDRSIHFYQSTYAQHFLYKKNMGKILPMKDYINLDFIKEDAASVEKENIVLYNPKKGYNITKKIIKHAPDIKFIPLQNLNRKELKHLMQRAKLYIDFGNFPGKDRLPREAVMNGACIITGREGAAYFFEDVAIDEKYKINNKKGTIIEIVYLIKDILNNFDAHSPMFNQYRDRIQKEQEEFYLNINQSFFIK